ncbi:MAG: hypothetical protein Q8922_15795 [Bacteroidota bacterium]|nr:hypothetical protein [Bacteroidota bacterium]MDP4232758.1 hypothetical protein [Bacteroidota bacterium]MDP4242560.1 hypothetical protein [Bacteroidota bacterium]MDP4289377.1 hypothetical protein [Bacteroidota bacterium]
MKHKRSRAGSAVENFGQQSVGRRRFGHDRWLTLSVIITKATGILLPPSLFPQSELPHN